MKTLTVHIQDESKVEEIRAYLAQYGPVQEHPTQPERWEDLPATSQQAIKEGLADGRAGREVSSEAFWAGKRLE